MKLPFAMKNGRMVTPDEVDAGLNCGCTCPNCGEPVMAKKGSIRVHHFAHLPSEKSEACDPNYARETAIHLMAKQIIADRRYFESPRFARSVAQKDMLLRNHYETAVIAEKETLQFVQIEVELPFEGYKPDLIGHTPDGRKILIEIRVTHRCSKEKIQWMRKSGLLALEVDLSNTELSPLPSKQEVEEAIKKAEAHWLSHPNYDTAMTQARDRLKKKVAQVTMKSERTRPKNARKSRQRPWTVRKRKENRQTAELIRMPLPPSRAIAVIMIRDGFYAGCAITCFPSRCPMRLVTWSM